MEYRINGAFDVTITPVGTAFEEAQLGRMSIDKRFHGPLAAASKGEMLAARSPVDGSAGYVAMERVTGRLDGRDGSFVLQHSGHMNRGAKSLSVTVVADSGTGELVGLAGSMDIVITDGKHFYDFTYTLPG
ncbi:MAG TPA: DUF3224 domain-containing protein [Burkholderiaceae bacterium]